MNNNFVVDPAVWEKLLAPIQLDKPTGEFLLYDPLYDQIQMARMQEDERLPQGVWQRDFKRADWARVEELCLTALTTRTKDLQIAAWLTEAWFMRYQIDGLLNGLTLINNLCELFWADLYPPLEADDMEYRLAPFQWLNEKFRERLSLTVLGKPLDPQTPELTYADWITVNQMPPIKTTSSSGTTADPNIMTLARFKKIQKQIPTSFYQNLLQMLEKVSDEIIHIEAFIVARNSMQQGALNLLRQDTQKLRDFCKATLAERGEAPSNQTGVIGQAVGNAEDEGKQATSASSRDPSFISKTISNREEAYRMLAEAADILARIEPHSPTPYLVRRAIAWGHMSLVELMQEMVHDSGNFMQIKQLLGIKEEQDEVEG